MPIVESAVEHGLAPLLDDEVRAVGLAGDRDALVRLAMHSLESAAATNRARDTLIRVADVAASLDLEIAVFKGLAIGARWYPHPQLRPAADVDIFVEPSQANRIGDLINALAPDGAASHAVDAMLRKGSVFEQSLDVGGTTVDLHVDPMNLVIPTRGQRILWQRTERIDLGADRSVRTLDLELSMIQALLHLMRDDFADLLHVDDIARMLDADPDWSFIEAFATGEGWRDLVRFSLSVVCDILRRPSPLSPTLTASNSALTRLFWPERIRLRGTDRVFQGAQRQSTASLLVTGRRFEVAGALTRRLFPPRSVIDERHPNAGSPYPVALVGWRRAQRAEIRRQRAIAPGVSEHASR
jgi:hypothetical protein